MFFELNFFYHYLTFKFIPIAATVYLNVFFFSIEPGHVSTKSLYLNLSPVAVVNILVEMPKFLDAPDMKMLRKCVIYDSWDLNVSLQWDCVAIKTLDLWF